MAAIAGWSGRTTPSWGVSSVRRQSVQQVIPRTACSVLANSAVRAVSRSVSLNAWVGTALRRSGVSRGIPCSKGLRPEDALRRPAAIAKGRLGRGRLEDRVEVPAVRCDSGKGSSSAGSITWSARSLSSDCPRGHRPGFIPRSRTKRRGAAASSLAGIQQMLTLPSRPSGCFEGVNGCVDRRRRTG